MIDTNSCKYFSHIFRLWPYLSKLIRVLLIYNVFGHFQLWKTNFRFVKSLGFFKGQKGIRFNKMLLDLIPAYFLECPCVCVFASQHLHACILALDADICGFEVRSTGHSDCLSVFSLRLGATDYLKEKEHNWANHSMCRERAFDFDLEGQKGTTLMYFLILVTTARTEDLCEDVWVMLKRVSDSFRCQAMLRTFTNFIHVKWNVQMMRDATCCRSPWAAFNSRFHFLSSFGFSSVIYQSNGHWDYVSGTSNMD